MPAWYDWILFLPASVAGVRVAPSYDCSHLFDGASVALLQRYAVGSGKFPVFDVIMAAFIGKRLTKITVQSIDAPYLVIHEVSSMVFLNRDKVKLVHHRAVGRAFSLLPDALLQIISGGVADQIGRPSIL